MCFRAFYGKKINAIERVPVIRRGICSFAFNITSRHEVELEELTGSAPVSAPAAPAAAPAPAASTAPAAGEQICAPMPGNILAVNVTAGQAVKKGDVLMVLEAMKMENEIMCPRDGVVASVNTSKGASVESGTLLCVLQ